MSSQHATHNPQSPLAYGAWLVRQSSILAAKASYRRANEITQQAVAWTFTATGIVLTIGRYIIRKSTLGKFLFDDYIHGFAVIVLIAYISTYTVLYPMSNAVELWGLKQGPKPSSASLIKFIHLEIAGEFLFWVVLYSVKFTFLIFYRHIFGVSSTFRKYWWGVFIFTCIAFCANFLTVLWTCGTPSQIFVLSTLLELQYLFALIQNNSLTLQSESCLSVSAQVATNNYAETCVALNIASDLASESNNYLVWNNLYANDVISHDSARSDVEEPPNAE